MKCLDIFHVRQMYQKSWSNDHILNCSWDARHARCNFYFSFWDIFCPVPPLTTPKNKLKRIWRKKTHLEVSSFYTCVPKIVITMVPKKYGARRMDRQTGGQKKWHIAMSVSPKKLWQVWKSPFQFSDKFGHVTC